jgi:hypothetical protein
LSFRIASAITLLGMEDIRKKEGKERKKEKKEKKVRK